MCASTADHADRRSRAVGSGDGPRWRHANMSKRKNQTSLSAIGAANVRRHPVRSQWERLEAIFTYPGLYDFRDLLPGSIDDTPSFDDSDEPHGPRRGRSCAYPDLLLFALAICSRACSSQNAMLAELKKPGRWVELCDLYREGLDRDVDIPMIPPSDSALDRFMVRLSDEREGCRRRWLGMSERLTHVGWGTARLLGNFADGYCPVDWTRPDHRYVVIGDGTYISPFTDALRQRCEVTGEEVILGSNAKTPNRARIQEQVTDPQPDDKTARGINHVTLSTWTDYGWVVLGTDHATGGEIYPTMVLLDRLLDLAKDRVHTVVWDRVLTGWAIQNLMATRRVMVINKAVARSGRAQFTVDGQKYRPWRIAKAIAVERFRAGQSLPLGTSIYQTTKGYERVNSEFNLLPRPKPLASCAREHVLWVDDGALFDSYLSDDGVWWKRPRAATALEAKPLPADDGTWSLPITWHLDCPDAPEGSHEFTTHWNPAPGRTGAASRGISKALRELRPVPRYADEQFGPIHGLRNITESFNQWFQKTLGQHKRAMRLNVPQQAIEHLCAGMLANAITYHRYLLCTDQE
jgi:hypothetical protein